MLLRLRRLVTTNQLDHVILPCFRRSIALVIDLEENVVEVIHRVDHLSDICVLDCRDGWIGQRLDLRTESIAIGIAIYPIDVIGGIERMAFPRVVLTGTGFGCNAPAIE